MRPHPLALQGEQAWKNLTAQQLVRYEALFKLLDDMQRINDIPLLASLAATRWKYFASVCSWRMVVFQDTGFLVIDAYRGEVQIESALKLSPWDNFHYSLQRPNIIINDGTFDGPLPPAHFADTHIPQLMVYPIQRDGRCIALLSLATRNDSFSELDKKFNHIFGSHFAGTIYTILFHKQAEEKLIAAKQDAEVANLAKSAFLANMSHEIRTPLNGLMGMLQLMHSSNQQKEQDEFINTAVRSCKRLTNLLSDILDLSRVEAGKMQIIENPFSLRDSLEGIVQLFHPTASSKGLRLSFQIDPAIPDCLIGDVVRIQQILNNLVGNGIKFTQEGGVVIYVQALTSNQDDFFRVLFSVKDTGTGISDTDLEKLFNPFTQVEERARKLSRGAGLGLAISKKLAELMHGNIAVTSKENVGSTFYLSLTLRKCRGLEPQQPMTGLPMVPENLKILLAEDDSISRTVAIKILKLFQCEVQAVENGSEVIAMLKQQDFDCVIVDVQMPVLSGIEAAQAIRRGDSGPEKCDIPIIAMTACAMSGDREKIIAAGIDGYVEKPIDIIMLRKEIFHVLSSSVSKQQC
jgi:signal transduction histidine kinase/CheY-like chemotaxis protein